MRGRLWRTSGCVPAGLAANVAPCFITSCRGFDCSQGYHRPWPRDCPGWTAERCARRRGEPSRDLGGIGLRAIGSRRAVGAIGLCIRALDPEGHSQKAEAYDTDQSALHYFISFWNTTKIVNAGTRQIFRKLDARFHKLYARYPCSRSGAAKVVTLSPPVRGRSVRRSGIRKSLLRTRRRW
jgi:hypothetical protein